MLIAQQLPVQGGRLTHELDGARTVAHRGPRQRERAEVGGDAVVPLAEDRAIHRERLPQQRIGFREPALQPQDDAEIREALRDEGVLLAEDPSVERERLTRERFPLVVTDPSDESAGSRDCSC